MLRKICHESGVAIYQCTDAFYRLVQKAWLPPEYYYDSEWRMCTEEEFKMGKKNEVRTEKNIAQ